MRKLRLLDSKGLHMRWIGEHEARGYLKEKRATLIWSRRRVEAVQLIDIAGELAKKFDQRLGRQAYSHDRETEDNPRGVWVYRRIPKSCKPLFTTSITDCLTQSTQTKS